MRVLASAVVPETVIFEWDSGSQLVRRTHADTNQQIVVIRLVVKDKEILAPETGFEPVTR